MASKDAEASEVTAFEASVVKACGPRTVGKLGEAFHGHWHSVRLRQRTQEAHCGRTCVRLIALSSFVFLKGLPASWTLAMDASM